LVAAPSPLGMSFLHNRNITYFVWEYRRHQFHRYVAYLLVVGDPSERRTIHLLTFQWIFPPPVFSQDFFDAGAYAVDGEAVLYILADRCCVDFLLVPAVRFDLGYTVTLALSAGRRGRSPAQCADR
jgi:hypothetical protein